MNATNSPESALPMPDDWHPADVLAALKKRGRSLAGLSVANGYHPTAAGKALKQPWPAMELLLADAIGVAPQEMWPAGMTTRAAHGGARRRDAPTSSTAGQLWPSGTGPILRSAAPKLSEIDAMDVRGAQ